MTADDDFRRGLSLRHLNPPEIGRFFRGLPRRVGDNLRPLHQQADSAETVAALTAMSDRAEGLVERLTPRHPVDPDVEVDTTNRPPGAGDRPELSGALDRLDRSVVELAGRLAGISANGWRTDHQLLDEARSVVADLAAELRRLEAAVSTANQRRIR